MVPCFRSNLKWNLSGNDLPHDWKERTLWLGLRLGSGLTLSVEGLSLSLKFRPRWPRRRLKLTSAKNPHIDIFITNSSTWHKVDIFCLKAVDAKSLADTPKLNKSTWFQKWALLSCTQKEIWSYFKESGFACLRRSHPDIKRITRYQMFEGNTSDMFLCTVKPILLTKKIDNLVTISMTLLCSSTCDVQHHFERHTSLPLPSRHSHL